MSVKDSSRRNFLKATTVGAAGAALLSGGVIENVLGKNAAILANGPGNKWPGRVVINFNKTAITKSGATLTDNQTVITQMVDDSIKLLTGQTTVGAAWKAVFPTTLTAASKIAMKVPVGYNNSKSAPNCYVVKAIVEGLKLMDFAGTKFPATNIYVYDQNGSQNYGAIGINATLLPGVHIVYSSNGSGYTDGARSMQYANTLHDCDFLINVPSLRGHGGEYGNATLGFKAHYGTYGPIHGDTAPAYLRDINGTGAVYNKTVLTVLSALFGQNLGNGPGGTPQDYTRYAATIDATSTNQCPNTIIMSTDPVSAEMQGHKAMRLNANPAQAYDTASMPAYLQASAGIAATYNGQAVTALNFGVLSEGSMDLRRIVNAPAATSVESPVHIETPTNGRMSAMQIAGSHSTLIEFMLPEAHLGNAASIEIFNAKGESVRTLSHTVVGVMNHLSWDQRDSRGNPGAAGMYVARLVSGTHSTSAPFTIGR